MPQSASQDGIYQLPTAVGNTGPNCDVTNAINSAGQAVDRQRFESYLGGSNIAVNNPGGTQAISNRPGACRRFICSTSGTTGALRFYDSATSATGNLIGFVPNTATVGQIFIFDFPALNGIFCQQDVGSPQGTLSFEKA